MASMFESIRALVTPAIVSRAAAQTGESESSITKGFNAAVPALVGTLAHRSDDRTFMNQLGSLSSSAATDTGTQPYGTVDATTTGGWLSTLFGSNLSGVTDSISRYAGLKTSSTTTILSMAAPMVLGYLGRLMRSENLDAAGLGQRLRAERRNLSTALPSGLEIPGVPRTTHEPVGAAARETRRADVVTPRHERASSGTGWGLPLVIGALALVGLLWWASRDRPGTEREQARIEEDAAVGTTGTTGRTTPPTDRQTVTRQLPGSAAALQMPSGSMEDQLLEYMQGTGAAPKTFTFDRIEFQTGSAMLTQDSQDQIRNVAAIMRAYPDMSVTVIGHTDTRGDPAANQRLSLERAESVSDALQAAGVSADRIETEGSGSDQPIADESLPSGRARNRTVTLEVTSK